MHNWKLNPSNLTFLWDECKRCFYLKVRCDFKRPGLPFPKIFGTIDLLMKDIYLAQSTKKISFALPEGKSTMAGRWVRSEPIKISGHTNTCYIQGIFDTVVHFNDGTYGIVDFKTTKARASHVDFYGRQLNAYAYALQHPAPGKLHLSPITRLGLLCFDPVYMDEFSPRSLALKGSAEWVEVPLDEEKFLSFIGDVMDLLELPEPPEVDPNCKFCAYRDAARNTGL